MNSPNAFVRFLNQNFSWLSIPYLPIIIAGLPVIPLLLESMGYPAGYYMFDPQRILAGEYWRLLALSGNSRSLLWLVIYVMYMHYLLNALESKWGENTLSLFVVLSYLSGIMAGFIFNSFVPVWYYVAMNVTLAFGTLYPNTELYLYFVLKIKAKWIAIIAGVFWLFQMISTSNQGRIILILVSLPYILFLGSDVFFDTKKWLEQKNRQRQFKRDMS